MIPILYRVNETNYLTNGLGRLTECVSCIVTEERNGIYECEFEYPITGKFYQELCTNGGIISVIHDDTKDLQLFDVYAHTDPIDGIVTFNARHISYRLANIILRPLTSGSVADLFTLIPNSTMNSCPFSFWTDKTTTGDYTLDHPSNIRAILGGTEGSILDVYGGGDYEFDNFQVKLYSNRGFDTGVTIRYGKNLADITNNVDTSSTYSAIVPYWTDGEGNTVYGNIVYSPYSRAAMIPWTKESGEEIENGGGNVIEFPYRIITPIDMDFSDRFESAPTSEQLEDAALQYMIRNETWNPYQNIEVDFVQLWQTPEYESVAALQRVSLCDRVSVYFPEMGIIQSEQKVIKTVYNVLLERYDSMELGNAKTSFASVITDGFDDAINQRSEFLQQFILEQTELIRGGLGGYVVTTANAAGQPQEILIMDTDDIETAVNVIRMNRNGIGFSTNGYEGPFESAWTISGRFNADFIATGSLNASMIQTGTMSADFIRGGILYVGGANDTNGIIRVQNSDGETIVEANRNGLFVWDGTIQGATIRAGGTNDQDGIFQLLNYDGTVNFQYDNAGMHHVTTTTSLSGDTVRRGTEISGTEMRSFWELTENGGGGVARSYISKHGEIWFYCSRGTPIQYKVVGIVNSQINTANDYILTISNMHGSQVAVDPPNIGIAYNSGWQLQSLISLSAAVTRASGNFACNGTKSRIVQTDEFSERSLYSYETPSPLFGDVGEAVLDEDGFCYVFLDPVFADTITTNRYQVFLQKYGQGDLWVAERKPGYFVVQGTAGLAFGWELKAKQKDFDQLRLEQPDALAPVIAQNYADESADYFENLMKERENA